MMEIKAWAFGVGHLSLRPKYRKSNAEFIRTLKEDCEGFLGVHPMDEGTLLIFETENDAKRSRNLLRSRGVRCGEGIEPVYIPEQFVRPRA